jgi:ribonucleoside-diphosphate reductase alpha chain
LIKEFPDLKFDTMRNVTVSSIAPTGSLSLMTPETVLSYGIEPAFDIFYWKRTRISGEYAYYFCVPRIVRDVYKKAGYEIPMESDTIEDHWDGRKGKKIADFIKKHYDDVGIKFVKAVDVNPMDKMDLMGKVMKWIDSSISVTYLLPEHTSTKEVEKFIMKSWEVGVKSIATFPDKEMYGIVSFTPFKDLAESLISKGTSIHPQNFSEEERKALNLSNTNISTTSAPERPKILDADIYTIRVSGKKFVVAIGLLNGTPYEIFAGEMDGLNFNFRERSGKLEKIGQGKYKLYVGEEIEIEDFSEHFKPAEKVLVRLVSLNLKHGVPLKYIIKQLSKSSDAVSSMPAAAARVLKKYLEKEESISDMSSCPNCSSSLIYEEGCAKCGTCGWSKCE